jgi:hypothetical protein
MSAGAQLLGNAADHLRLRRLVTQALSVWMIEESRPFIRAVAADLAATQRPLRTGRPAATVRPPLNRDAAPGCPVTCTSQPLNPIGDAPLAMVLHS